MSSAFASFHLTIAAPHGDRYPVTARTQAGHEVSEALLLPLDDPTLTVYQTALDYHTPIDESVVIAVGQLLYQTLFQGAIAEAFATARAHADQQTAALRIHLAIDADTRLSAAAALPWELMATAAGRPLILEHALVRTFPWNDPIPDLGIPAGERIRLAVTSALPTELANHPIAAEAEVAFIRAAITHSSRPIDLIEVPHLTRDRLTDLLTNQRPHIVHHIGHGSIQRGMGYLDIERADQSRDRLSAREFSTMLHQSGVQLVVLNACHTSSAGESLLTSFAPIFITDRIPAVIGMQAAILNRTGHCFANAFYATLGHGGSIDASLIAARKAIHADGHEHGAWGFPTLYSRVPHGQMWGDPMPQPVDPLAQRDRERITKAAQQIESDRLLNLRLQGFVGRVNELAAIREQIETMRPTGGYVLIKAAAGEGKSSSIAKLIQEAGIAQTPHHFIALTTGREYQLGLLRAVVAQLILKHHLTVSYFPEESYPAMKGEFARILDDLSKQGIQETIYLDGLDQLQPEIDGSRDLSFLPPQPPPGIVIVLGSRPDETLKPLEILHRVDYALPPLSEADALALWRSVQPGVASGLLHDLYRSLKGNALFVHLAADTMQGASVIDATSLIKQIEQNPSNLFGITLERIKNRSEHRWPTIWKPMLALLLVAQEPLRLDVLSDLLGHDHDTMQDAVWVLGGLVSQGIDQRVALHHLLFRDYLAASVFNAREIKRWHQRLADWCGANLDAIWADDHDPIEQARRVYARYHYITHLALAENWTMLWQVLDAGDYGEQKTQFDPSTRLYVLDLDRGRESAIKAGQSTDEHIQNLPRLWKYSLLRTSLTSRVDQWPDDLFIVLAMIGRKQEALERTELVSDTNRQIKIWANIIKYYENQQQDIIFSRIFQALEKCNDMNYIEGVCFLSEAYVCISNYEDALSILKEASIIAQTIMDAKIRNYNLNIIIKTVTIIATYSKSAMLLEWATTIAHSIDDIWQKIESIARIIRVYIAIGNPRQADILFDIIIDLINDSEAEDNTYDSETSLSANHPRSFESNILANRKDAIVNTAIAIASTGKFKQAIDVITLAKSQLLIDGDPMEAISRVIMFFATTDFIQVPDIQEQVLSIAQSINNEWKRAKVLVTIGINIVSNNYAWVTTLLEHASTLVPRMNDTKEKVNALIFLAVSYASIGKPYHVNLLLQQLNSIPYGDSDPWMREYTLTKVATEIAYSGNFDQSVAIAQSIKTMERRSYALAVLVRIAVSVKDLEYAASIAQNIENKDIYVYIISNTIQLAAVRDKKMQNTTSLNKAFSIAQTMKDNDIFINFTDIEQEYKTGIYLDITREAFNTQQRREKAFDYIIEAYLSIGDASSAINIVPYIGDFAKKIDVIIKIATTAYSMNNYAQAMSLLAQAISLVRSLSFPWIRAEMLILIANAYNSIAMPDKTLSILSQAEMLISSIEYDHLRQSILKSIIETLTVLGNVEKAIAIIHSIEDSNTQDEMFSLIAITSIVTNGNLSQATIIAQSITNSKTRLFTLIDMIKAIPSTFNKDRITHILTDIMEGIQLVDDTLTRTSLFITLTTLYISLGNIAQATIALKEASKIIPSIDSSSNYASAINMILKTISSCIQDVQGTPLLEKVILLIESIPQTHNSASINMNLAIFYMSIDRLIDAIAIAKEIDDPKKCEHVLIGIIKASASVPLSTQRTILNDVIAIAQTIKDRWIQTKVFASIIETGLQIHVDITNIIQNNLNTSKTDHNTWLSLSMITPLIKNYPWLGKEILEGEAWVNEQLKRLG